jgi:hypothetical protein
MCTVSFLPLDDGGYLLATNRDESPRRGPADPPRELTAGGRRMLAPVDTDAGGTWVAVDEQGRTLCILNGDRPPARPPAHDAPSRGLLVLESMEDPRLAAVEARLEQRLRGRTLRERPFKLLVAEPGGSGDPARLARIDWDGSRLETSLLDGPAVAVSSTQLSEAVTAARTSAFADFQDSVAPWRDDARALAAAQHRWHAGHTATAPDGDAFSVCMHRPDARTVSCTLVAVTPRTVTLRYQPGHPCQGAELATVSLERDAG